jgi:ATP-dependent Clp protease protease subunit
MDENLQPFLQAQFPNRLFEARTILISGEITQQVARHVMDQLLGMAAASDEPITLIINSQGGHVEAGDTIHDMIRFVKPRIRIIGTGWVASAGALIFVSVPIEDRYCLPNTRFLLHQPAGSVQGNASEIAIEAEEIVKMRRRINEIFSRQTGRTVQDIERKSNRNFWLSAEEAKDYGLVGQIVEHAHEVYKPETEQTLQSTEA